MFHCKYNKFTVNDPIFKNHSIADDLRPIQPKNDSLA